MAMADELLRSPSPIKIPSFAPSAIQLAREPSPVFPPSGLTRAQKLERRRRGERGETLDLHLTDDDANEPSIRPRPLPSSQVSQRKTKSQDQRKRKVIEPDSESEEEAPEPPPSKHPKRAPDPVHPPRQAEQGPGPKLTKANAAKKPASQKEVKAVAPKASQPEKKEKKAPAKKTTQKSTTKSSHTTIKKAPKGFDPKAIVKALGSLAKRSRAVYEADEELQEDTKEVIRNAFDSFLLLGSTLTLAVPKVSQASVKKHDKAKADLRNLQSRLKECQAEREEELELWQRSRQRYHQTRPLHDYALRLQTSLAQWHPTRAPRPETMTDADVLVGAHLVGQRVKPGVDRRLQELLDILPS